MGSSKPNKKPIAMIITLLVVLISVLIIILFSMIRTRTLNNNPSDKVSGASSTDNNYVVILDDMADLLSETEEEQLLNDMEPITAYGNVAFVSTYDSYSSASAYADYYYHEAFGTDSGSLFLIDMDNREIYVFCDGNIYDTVDDSYAYTITDNIYRYASDEEYYDCAANAYEQILDLLEGRRIAQPMKYASNLFLALLLAALINYVLANILSGTAKANSDDMLAVIDSGYSLCNPEKVHTHTTKEYSPQSSGSGGSGGGGGGSSGGGGGHSF